MERLTTAHHAVSNVLKEEKVEDDEVLKGLLCDPASMCFTPTAPTPAELKR